MAGIGTLDPYRDPRTAFGGGASATRPRIPVGQVIEGPVVPAQAPVPAAATTAAPLPPQTGIGTMPQAAKPGLVSRAGTALRSAAGGLGRLAMGPVGIAATLASVGSELGGALRDKFNAANPDGVANTFGGVGFDPMSGLPNVSDMASATEMANTSTGPQPVAAAKPAVVAPQGQRMPMGTGADNADALPPTAAAPAGIGDGIAFNPKTKEYSGADVKAGAPIAGGRGGGTVTSLQTPGVGGYVEQLNNIRGIGSMPSQSVGDGGVTVGQAAGGFGIDPAKVEREANFERKVSIGRLESASRLNPTSRSRDAATQAYAAAAAQPMPAAVQQAQERQAAVTTRGQDIGLASQQLQAGTSRDIATLQGRTQRDVATINADGRAEAASLRANPTVVVGGGMVEVDDGVGGKKFVTAPQRLVNRVTGEEIGAKPAPKPNYTKGQVYSDAKGNKATWDGEKFVPAK